MGTSGAEPDTQPDPRQSSSPEKLPAVVVTGASLATKQKHVIADDDGARITVTKRHSVEILSERPSVIDNSLREMFMRVPGLVISEQQNPDQFNFNYRGVGNPQESEFTLSLRDGIPIASDLIGFPTQYYLPPPQSLERMEFIRGGASLLYGPEPGPVMNFISRKPVQQGLAGRSENTYGSRRTSTTFNEVSGTDGPYSYLANIGARDSAGERFNGQYHVLSGDAHIGFALSPTQMLTLDFQVYQTSAGDPGRMSFTQYQIDPYTTTTPFNHTWIQRETAIVGFEGKLDTRTQLIAKLWGGEQLIQRRTAANFIPPQAPPATTVVEDMRFVYAGLDLRLLRRYGSGSAVTVGATAYESHSPWRQYTNSNLSANAGDTSGTPRVRQDRGTHYAAFFAENLIRQGEYHYVMSARYDRETLGISEMVKPSTTIRPLLTKSYSRGVPLFGVGFGKDFGPGYESYVNISQGYRPLRYLDVASPTSNVAASNNPDPSRFITYEAGIHGWPRGGAYFDAGVFYVDFKHRIESQQINNTDVININTGHTRHQGLELEGEVDIFALARDKAGDDSLKIFANATILDAKFVESNKPNLIGLRPAFAPKYVARAGLIWRADGKWLASLNATYVANQFWQDSNQAFGSGATYLPPTIPAYTVTDAALEYRVSRHLKIMGGIKNLLDRKYYARVFQNGLEPGSRRAFYAGIGIDI
jgi:Fe(3+) dicitrate transport protein